jgi:nucleotide-binding universal stress UspA family protein
MELKRIFVAVDADHGRDAAFDRALALARSSGAELYLLQTVPATQRLAYRSTERLELMADLRKAAEDAGVRVDTAEQHGEPAAMIALHANTRAADLIVMAAGAPEGWWRRSAAQRVMRLTAVPVLAIPREAATDPAAPLDQLLAA